MAKEETPLKSGLPKWTLFGNSFGDETMLTISGFSTEIQQLVEENQEMLSSLKKSILRDVSLLLESVKAESINCLTISKILKKLEKRLQADFRTEGSLAEWMFQKVTVDFLFLYLRDDIIRLILEKFCSQFDFWWEGKKIDSWTLKIIDTVLWERVLSTLLTMLKEKWAIDISDNIINSFDYEEEVKVINIRKEEIIRKLVDRWAKPTFEWHVIDEYYDYPDGIEWLGTSGWSKSTFRIRTKIDRDGNKEYFYTIKRKLTKEEEERLIRDGVMDKQEIPTRRCYEKELRINDITTFRKMVEDFGMVNPRTKQKDRVSYTLEEFEGLKFDFDSYDGYKDMLELEGSSNAVIKRVLDDPDLWLWEYDTLVWWESKFKNDSRTRKK